MAQEEHVSRRRMLRLTGVAMSTALVAGCGGDGNGGDGNGGNGGGGVEIEPGMAIEFDGQTSGWEGLAPSVIEGEVNPTLVLQEGETYEIGWTVGDGAQHNIEIRNESDEVVDGLQTEVVTEPEDQWLEFEASPEMVTYICRIHPTTMIGDLQVESGGGGDTTDENETGNETDNETGDNMTS